MFKNKIFIIAVIFVLIAIMGLAKIKLSKEGSVSSDLATFEIVRGPLTISVIESGTIRAREQIIIKNEVEGRTSIIYLIPEGTLVKKGELLVELDASTLEDNKIDQEIDVQKTGASHINAKENLAVVENQAKSDKDLAKLTLKFANQDLNKYLEGEYPNELRKAEAEITLAKEDLTRAQDTNEWSTRLFNEKYISYTELQADQLAVKKKKLDLQLAEDNLELLKEYTYTRNVAQFESDVNQAEMALERTNRKAKADVVQAQAELTAKQAEYQRQQDKLKKIEDQIEKTKIYAPADGLVIYATSAKGSWRGNVEPLEEGYDVREREELIYLPTANSSKAEVDIHESNLEKIRTDLPAIITVDALPGKKYAGTVANIAPLPDAQSMWMNPDLKIYNTEIYLDDNSADLKTGMSCLAEIIIEQYQDALYVPIQAVMRIGGEPTVYVKKGKSFEPRKVRTGLDNNRMIHIIEGLQDGQVVLLTPPLAPAATDYQIQSSISQNERSSSYSDEKMTEKVKEKSQSPSRTLETDTKNTQTDDDRMNKERPSRVSPEQRQSRQRRFENMTEEEREKMRKRFENMSPEEKEKIRQRPKESQSGN